MSSQDLQSIRSVKLPSTETLALRRKRKAEADAAAAAAPKKRLKKDTKLLSFGEDAEGDDEDDGDAQPDGRANGHRGGVRSAHDVRAALVTVSLQDPKTVAQLRHCCDRAIGLSQAGQIGATGSPFVRSAHGDVLPWVWSNFRVKIRPFIFDLALRTGFVFLAGPRGRAIGEGRHGEGCRAGSSGSG